jgi:chromosome partitioning protein
MKRLAFCNNGGGGKATLVFHLAHMLADLGRRPLLVDLDPQSTLTAMCVSEERLAELWLDAPENSLTIMGALASGGDPYVEPLRDGLGLVAGDLGLSGWEGPLAAAWVRASDGDELASRTLMALPQVIDHAARQHAADVVLVNAGPNVGAINRAALAATDLVVIPLAPDPFAIRGLLTLGPTLASWRRDAAARTARFPDPELARLAGAMDPLGYIITQASMRLHRPAQTYERWLRRVPNEYHRSVLEAPLLPPPIDQDRWYLGTMRPYHGLALLARDASKPMFHLRPADGAVGSHMAAVTRCREDFETLTRTLLDRAGLSA